MEKIKVLIEVTKNHRTYTAKVDIGEYGSFLVTSKSANENDEGNLYSLVIDKLRKTYKLSSDEIETVYTWKYRYFLIGYQTRELTGSLTVTNTLFPPMTYIKELIGKDFSITFVYEFASYEDALNYSK